MIIWHSLIDDPPTGNERWIVLFVKNGEEELSYYFYPDVGIKKNTTIYTHWRERVTPDDPLPSCIWTREDDPDVRTVYQTACGDAHQIMTGTPTENGYRYCPYCGNRILVTPTE